MLKDPKNIAILVLCILSAVLAGFLLGRKPPVEVRYIPEEVIVERILQTETIAVPDEALLDLVEEALGSNYREVMQHLDDLEFQISALQTVVSRGTGSTVETVIVNEDCSINETFEELIVEFTSEGQEPETVPVASVEVSAQGLLTAQAYDLELELSNIITESTEGALSTISTLTLTSNGLLYEIPISGTTYYNLRQPDVFSNIKRFNLWDPYLDLSVDAGAWSGPLRLRPGASIGFSTSSVKRANQPVWRFIRAGVGFSTDRKAYFSLTPATYNLGRNLPVFDDLWIGPGLGLNTNGNWIITLGLGTTL